VNFVLVPIKALAWGKSRLSPLLPDPARHALSRAMLTDVLTSVRLASTVDGLAVVSSDATLLALARQLGAAAVDEEYPRGLNGAVAVGTDFCLRQGATTLLVLLADLPLVKAQDIDFLFRLLTGGPEVVLVPCKEGEGTNALLRVPPLVIAPCFGGPSLSAHQQVTQREGISCRVVEVPHVAFDVDSLTDLEYFALQRVETHTSRLLREFGVGVDSVEKKAR
jgi:2-phospho-L-lactate/phosphoenolpyruvate guanylyltransferase